MKYPNYSVVSNSSLINATAFIPFKRVAKNISEEFSTVSSVRYGDYIARILKGELVGISETHAVFKKIESYHEEIKKIIDVSREVITSLKKNLDYNGYYTSYLLEQISDDEFSEISEKYAIELSNEYSKEAYDKIRTLFQISDQSFTPSELSNIFKIEETITEEIIKQLKELKHIDSKEIAE